MFMLYLIHGSVADQKTDAIVNAANRALAGGGGVDGAIHALAGPELDHACRKIGFCPTGQAVVTPSFNLEARTGCRFIVHTVGPIYARETPQCAREQLASCYRTSCEEARHAGARTISFCSISTGVYGYPLEEALPLALDILLAEAPSFDEIRFCLFKDAEFRQGKALAEQLFVCKDAPEGIAVEKLR